MTALSDKKDNSKKKQKVDSDKKKSLKQEKHLHLAEKQIEKLNAIGIALTSEYNLEKLLQLIVSEARNLTQADAGTLYIREKNQLNFEISQNDTILKSLGHVPYTKFSVPIDKSSIAGFVALTGNILNIPDAYEISPESDFTISKSFDQKTGYRTKSMLVVPLIIPMDDKEKKIKEGSENIIGVLQLINSINKKGKVVEFLPSYEDLVRSLASQAAVALRNAQLINRIKDLFNALVQYSATAIDERSPHTAGHSRRVAELSVKIAQCISEQTEGVFKDTFFSKEELEEINCAAWLHDIGKLGVKESVSEKSSRVSPDRMELIKWRFECAILEQEKKTLIQKLNQQINTELRSPQELIDQLRQDVEFLEKINARHSLTDDEFERVQEIAQRAITDAEGSIMPLLTALEVENLSIKRGNLTPEEWIEMRSHPAKTFRILAKMPFPESLQRVPKIAGAHHELINGAGYPYHLSGSEILLQARILTVADIFDALTAMDRPYKPAMPLDKALHILKEEAAINRIDKDIVELFIENKLYEGISNRKDTR